MSENTSIDPVLLEPVASLDPEVREDVMLLEARHMRIDRKQNSRPKHHLLPKSYPPLSREKMKNSNNIRISNFHAKDIPGQSSRKVSNYNILRAGVENVQ